MNIIRLYAMQAIVYFNGYRVTASVAYNRDKITYLSIHFLTTIEEVQVSAWRSHEGARHVCIRSYRHYTYHCIQFQLRWTCSNLLSSEKE